MMDLRCQQPLLMESPHNTHKQKALLEFFLIANTKAVSNKVLRMQVFGQYSVCQLTIFMVSSKGRNNCSVFLLDRLDAIRTLLVLIEVAVHASKYF